MKNWISGKPKDSRIRKIQEDTRNTQRKNQKSGGKRMEEEQEQ